MPDAGFELPARTGDLRFIKQMKGIIAVRFRVLSLERSYYLDEEIEPLLKYNSKSQGLHSFWWKIFFIVSFLDRTQHIS